MKFKCSIHGEVNPTAIRYSCPAQANCPICGEFMEDLEGGIKVLSEEEAVLKRPDFYKEHHPDIYGKYLAFDGERKIPSMNEILDDTENFIHQEEERIQRLKKSRS